MGFDSELKMTSTGQWEGAYKGATQTLDATAHKIADSLSQGCRIDFDAARQQLKV